MPVGTDEDTGRRNKRLNNHLKLTLFKIAVFCCNFKLKWCGTCFFEAFFILIDGFGGKWLGDFQLKTPSDLTEALLVILFWHVEVKRVELT